MTDKHIPASKLEALPKIKLIEPIPESTFQTREVDCVRLNDLRALIDEATEVEPVAYLKEWQNSTLDRKRLDFNEFCEWQLIDFGATVTPIYTSPPPSPDLTKLVGELFEALEHSRKCLEVANMCGAINDTLWASKTETLFDYMDAAISRAKEYLK